MVYEAAGDDPGGPGGVRLSAPAAPLREPFCDGTKVPLSRATRSKTLAQSALPRSRGHAPNSGNARLRGPRVDLLLGARADRRETDRVAVRRRCPDETRKIPVASRAGVPVQPQARHLGRGARRLRALLRREVAAVDIRADGSVQQH